MKVYEAIGVVEVKYYTTALQVVDAMCKASDVELLSSEKTLGGALVTLIVGGTTSNVNAAVDTAKLACEGRENLLKMALVISRPHEEIMKFIVKKETTKRRGKSVKKKIEEVKES